ncbi:MULTISPECIES: peptidase domain-containing ABC transporter [Streptomyces]|uniref:peptidase domain-containing ABC transporter n=1 Tax=Streptomyces TaxID=1883 RepID=UPI001CCA3266|nr:MULTISPECIES: peptidase domain-containing ABC transporter [Streptomyces]MCU8590798.1 peptidase domain-containing ABC transporter [Streptomyces sp. A13(2022)]UOG77965.1 peptidase domain-containing ABC transporter [Streptomyces sp. CB09030]
MTATTATQKKDTRGKVRTARRVPTVTQVTQTECGLCSSIALLRYYGRAEEIVSARSVMEAGRDGLSASQLAQFLESRGMRVKPYRVRNVAALANFTSPVILYWENYHFVVLESFDGRTAVVMDPAVGRRRISRAELEKSFTEIVLSAEPGDTFERKRATPFAEWRKFLVITAETKKRIALVALLSLSGYGTVLGIPVLTRWAVDRYAQWHGFGDAAVVLAAVLAAAVCYLALHLTRVVLLSSLIAVLGKDLMSQTFTRLLNLPFKFFTTRPPGELMYRLNSVTAVRDLVSSRTAQGVLDVGTLLCVTVYLLVTEWRLGSVAVGIFLLNALYLMKTRYRVTEAVDSEIAYLAKSQGTQLDAIVSIPAIKMGGYAEEFLRGWNETYGNSLDAMRTRMRLQQGRIAGLSTTTQMFGPLILLLLSLYMVSHGSISLGAAVSVQAISATYFSLANSVFQTYTSFNEVSRYVARLSEISDEEPEAAGGDRTELVAPSVTLKNVDFRFTLHSELVVRNVSMTIGAGERVALVGPSGSGKSTLGRIICGLYEATGGTIEYGGHDLGEYDRSALRRTIGYIPQEVHMHNRTILENLTLGKDLSEEYVREFCGRLGILDFVEELPMGYQTLVSDMGANFSGGQRQRIAIARALLGDPKILVMDEATAALDNINERRVLRAISEIGATQIVIAHRLATVKSADRIYVFDNGTITEAGTHQSLLGDGDLYADLYGEDDLERTLVAGERA